METRTWINFTLGLIILANLLQVAGFVAPMWIWLDVESFTVGVGLWYSVGCGMDDTCKTATPPVSFGYSADDTFEDLKFKAVQALQTLGTVGGILGLLFMILYKKGYGAWRMLKHIHLALFITCIITWLCVLIGVMVYCGSFWPVVGTSPLVSSNSFPWCMLLCLLAGVLFVIASVLVRAKCWDSQFVKHAIPVSGVSQIHLHPVTKQGFWNRYFTPAYHETRRANHAIALQNEGMGATAMNGRLTDGGSDRRSVAAFDNMAFEGNALETGFNYRYLPPPQSTTLNSPLRELPQFPQAVLTPPLPMGLRRSFADEADNAYEFSRFSRKLPPDYNASRRQMQESAPTEFDFNRFNRQESTQYAVVNRRGVQQHDYPTAPRDLQRAMSHDRAAGGNGGVTTRDVAGYYTYNDGGVAAERDLTLNTRYVTATRGTNAKMPTFVLSPQSTQPPLSPAMSDNMAARLGGQPGPYVTRLDVMGPDVMPSGAYMAGMTDIQDQRLRVLADNSVDTRFTNEGRMTAGADYLSAEYRARGGRAMSQAGSTHSGRSALNSTTHLGPLVPAAAARSVWSASGSGASLFHPNYIYRPHSQQMY